MLGSCVMIGGSVYRPHPFVIVSDFETDADSEAFSSSWKREHTLSGLYSVVWKQWTVETRRGLFQVVRTAQRIVGAVLRDLTACRGV